MHIQINTEQPLTEIDLAVLRALAGTAPAETPAAPPTEEAPKKRATRKKADVEAEEVKARAEAEQQDAEKLAKQATTPEEPPAKLASVPDPEEKPDPKALIEDAASRATHLIRSGKRDDVKGILDGMGLEKVTALKDNPEKVQDFLDRIAALED
jgi:hypothetical protein